MNYRHAYHAGNFADVIKHAVLVRILLHLRAKPAAFRIIDTHAGSGIYDLSGAEAGKTLEWREGIGRLRDTSLDPRTKELLMPYLDAVAALNPSDRLTLYPGSPKLVQRLLRPQDRLTACEIEPKAAATLQHALRGDARTKAIAIDGWTALQAYVPPKERRGLVLIDPPFEQPGEFPHIVQSLAAAHRKWPTGGYLVWYPVKDQNEVRAFTQKLVRLSLTKMLRVELILANANSDMGLRGSGLIVVNPPWTLHDELKVMLPMLGALLSRGAAPNWTLDWLSQESAV